MLSLLLPLPPLLPLLLPPDWLGELGELWFCVPLLPLPPLELLPAAGCFDRLDILLSHADSMGIMTNISKARDVIFFISMPPCCERMKHNNIFPAWYETFG